MFKRKGITSLYAVDDDIPQDQTIQNAIKYDFQPLSVPYNSTDFIYDLKYITLGK